MSEEEFAATQKRSGRAQHKSGWPFPTAEKKAHKYHAKPVNGYDSTAEAKRAHELALRCRAGEIRRLREQVPFLLIDEQRDANGNLLERSVSFIADFVYEENGQLVVEDCKGLRAGTAYALYVIKRKLLLLRHGIRVREVYRGS